MNQFKSIFLCNFAYLFYVLKAKVSRGLRPFFHPTMMLLKKQNYIMSTDTMLS